MKSIEQQRATFEAWHRRKFATRHNTGQPTRDMHNGVYDENYGPVCQQHMWEAFQAAIEFDRQARGEPVGYVHPNVAAYGVKEGAMIYSTSYFVEGAGVPVYLHPQPAEPAVKESLTVAEPVKEVSDAVSFDAKALAIPGGMLAFDDGSLLVRADGSGYIAVPEDQFALYDDRCEGPNGPQGSVYWIAELPASEIVALRDFLNGQPAQPAAQPSVPDGLIAALRNQRQIDKDGSEVAVSRQAVDEAADLLDKYGASVDGQAQQDADGVDPDILGWLASNGATQQERQP